MNKWFKQNFNGKHLRRAKCSGVNETSQKEKNKPTDIQSQKKDKIHSHHSHIHMQQTCSHNWQSKKAKQIKWSFGWAYKSNDPSVFGEHSYRIKCVKCSLVRKMSYSMFYDADFGRIQNLIAKNDQTVERQNGGIWNVNCWIVYSAFSSASDEKSFCDRCQAHQVLLALFRVMFSL